MHVDETARPGGQNPLTLAQVLGHVIAYPTSAPSLRLAIRQHFSQVEDVITLIKVINSWIFESAKKTIAIDLGDLVRDFKQGEHVSNERAVEKDGLPRLDLVCSAIPPTSDLLNRILFFSSCPSHIVCWTRL